jgi:DNA-binding beta-propeller fold protein YncE
MGKNSTVPIILKVKFISDTDTNTHTKSVNINRPGPRGIAFTSDGTLAAVATSTDPDVALIDTSSETQVGEVVLNLTGVQVNGIEIHPTLNRWSEEA